MTEDESLETIRTYCEAAVRAAGLVGHPELVYQEYGDLIDRHYQQQAETAKATLARSLGLDVNNKQAEKER